MGWYWNVTNHNKTQKVLAPSNILNLLFILQMIDPTPEATRKYYVVVKEYITLTQALDFVQYYQNLHGNDIVSATLYRSTVNGNYVATLIMKVQ